MVRFAPLVAAAVIFVSCGGGSGTPDAARDPDAGPPDAGPPVDVIVPDATPPGPGTSCGTAIDITDLDEPASYDTSSFPNGRQSSCSGGTMFSPEIVFVVQAGDVPVDLLVDVLVDEQVSPPFDAALSSRAVCDDILTETACVDLGWSERLEILGATGPQFVFVDGTGEFGGDAAGPFTIDVARRTIEADGAACDPAGITSRCGADLICNGGVCEPTSAQLACDAAIDVTADLTDDFTAELVETVLSTDPGYYLASCAFDANASRPERIIRMDLLFDAVFTATTDDAATSYDTVLSIRSAACDGPEIACNDDVDLAGGNYRSRVEATLPAGSHFLFVDTSTPFVYGPPGTSRTFRLTMTIAPP